jgi:hypothetical protein
LVPAALQEILGDSWGFNDAGDWGGFFIFNTYDLGVYIRYISSLLPFNGGDCDTSGFINNHNISHRIHGAGIYANIKGVY